MSVHPRVFLRVEGLAALAVAVGAYLTLDGPLWLFLVLALAPDLSMAAYLAGPRVGSLGYNLVHTYTLPLALGGVGFWTDAHVAMLVAAIWAAHIGADRVAGYGLKFETGFGDTHLSTQPAPASVLEDPD
jgi:hypothetical protein